MNILFMCVKNSARSQMAEGLAKTMLGDRVLVESAGSQPSSIHPLTIAVMKELGIDISKNTSKSVDQLSPQFIAGLNYIITLCTDEVCPTMVAQRAKKLHWPIPDPVDKNAGEEQQLKDFRMARDAIQKKLVEAIRDELLK